MSLYNNLFGFEDAAPDLLIMLNINHNDIPRFRDVYLHDGYIVIHTRTGGDNREFYENENNDLRKHPNYVKDEDDDFDCTYANFYFSYPQEYAEALTAFAADNPMMTPAEKWKIFFEAMDKKAAEKNETPK